MKSFLFKLRYVFRNVTRNPFRTLSLFLTLVMLSFILITTFTIKGTLNDGYTYFETIRHANIDIEISYDAHSQNHIVDANKLKKVNKYIEYQAAFFELPVNINNGKGSTTATMQAGTTEELNPFLGLNLAHLQYDECIITSDIAKALKTEIGDHVEININSKNYNFKVVNIITADSLFSESHILIQKDYFLKNYAKDAFGIDASEITSTNLATNIYINLNDDVDLSAFCELLNTDNYYNGSLVRDPRNVEALASDIEVGVGVLYAALAIFISALVFVLVSIINLRIRNFKNEVGSIETLGENKAYMFKVLALEIIILSIISVILAYLLNTFIYTKEFSILSRKGHFVFNYKWYHFALTFGFLYLVCGYTLLRNYIKYKKKETISLAKDKSYDEVMSVKSLIIANSIVLALWLVDYFILYKALPRVIGGVLGIILTLTFGLLFVSLSLKIICKIFKFNPIFTKTFLHNLRVNRIKHNSLKILLVCLFGIVICFLCVETIEREMSRIENNLNLEYVLVMPSGVTEEMIESIKEAPTVLSVASGYFEYNLATSDGKHTFLMVYSCEVDKTIDIMNYTIDEKYHEKLTNGKKRYVILNPDFLITSGLNVGDNITFDISGSDVTYEILGTANLPFQQFAYTNEYYYSNEKIQTVIIQNEGTNTEKKAFRQEINEKFDDKLYYLFDASDKLKTFFVRARMALDLIYVVIAIIIGCFIISIINNTILSFQEIKTDLATIQVLGISPASTYKLFFEEMLISYVAVILPVIFMLLSVFKFFGGFTLIFGYYIEISHTFTTILIGLGVGILCFAISFIYYFVGVKHINVCEEIKK